MIEIMDGVTDIVLGKDPLVPQGRDPLTAKPMPTGVRVSVGFQRRSPLPLRATVKLRYDIADNGCEREVEGVPLPTYTVMSGDSVFYHYRLSYWLAPGAVMRFLPSRRSNHER
jgi:hypothetical protein